MKLLNSQKRILLLLWLFIISTLLLFYSFTLTLAEPDCNNPGAGDIDYCLQKIEGEINALKPAHEYNKKELTDLRNQIARLEKQIVGISKQLDVTEDNILLREEDLAYAIEVFEEKTKNHYKFVRLYDPIVPFLASANAPTAF